MSEYTDPGCSWAWGSEPKLRLLQWRYGHLTDWRSVMGGMVGDLLENLARDGRDDLDLRADAARFAHYWEKVHRHTGMPWPMKLRSMYRTTRVACIAVKAAERQSPEVGARVLRRFREWVFVIGEPFDNKVAAVAAVSGVPGLDVDRYVADLDDPETLVAFERDWEETRRPNPFVRNLQDDHEGHGRPKADGNRWRYAFPTLVVAGPGGEYTVAGWKPLEDYLEAFERACPGIGASGRPDPTTDEVLDHWGTATDVELVTLCGPRGIDPTDAIAHECGGGVLFLRPSEARAFGVLPG